MHWRNALHLLRPTNLRPERLSAAFSSANVTLFQAPVGAGTSLISLSLLC
jgi:hypothetical protein